VEEGKYFIYKRFNLNKFYRASCNAGGGGGGGYQGQFNLLFY